MGQFVVRTSNRGANRGVRDSLSGVPSGSRPSEHGSYAGALMSPPVTRNSQRMTRNQQDISLWLNTDNEAQSSQPHVQCDLPQAHANDSFVSDSVSTVYELDTISGVNSGGPPSDTTALLLEIRRDVKSMNLKFDTLEKYVDHLKSDNTLIRQQNTALVEKVRRRYGNVN
ncbi:MAG: hypothetical protein ABW185_27470 [Sedimenticola sp.]